jgi:hypothetical protein
MPRDRLLDTHQRYNAVTVFDLPEHRLLERDNRLSRMQLLVPRMLFRR